MDACLRLKRNIRIDRCQFVVIVDAIYLMFSWRTEELNL
jgi:hypothetical protein